MASAISLAGWEAKGLVAGWARADIRAVLDVSLDAGGREPVGGKTAILAEAKGFSGLPDTGGGHASGITRGPGAAAALRFDSAAPRA